MAVVAPSSPLPSARVILGGGEGKTMCRCHDPTLFCCFFFTLWGNHRVKRCKTFRRCGSSGRTLRQDVRLTPFPTPYCSRMRIANNKQTHGKMWKRRRRSAEQLWYVFEDSQVIRLMPSGLCNSFLHLMVDDM